jgi:RNA polymerase sigma-70 factor, ECF subfamily
MKEGILINGLKNRDKVIFDYTFNHYYSGLCAFSMQYLNDKDAVEDLVQDFFVYLWMEGPRLQILHSLKSYLFSSIRNRCLDIQKHQSVHERYKKHYLNSANVSDNISDYHLVESELNVLIMRSMDKLPPRCREIFNLSRVQGLSNQQISEQLNLSKRTVELQISNALKNLRLELSDYLPILFFLLFIG